ncbi:MULTISPECIES: cytochrome-c peroxidase [unclassified Pseudomonas]|uniref:cytochrome-c peroxidase n=1 Tax=unclassified Pseudomonas TaxID=196821 RepID=UPI0008714877|nr:MULTISPECIES: cytochrome c peroxidase [unclassified Pseudomonas]SCW60298.1 cytochrome c peroxidase [Pseudomonas sp. NFACC05-1]SCZ36938.1 cytochrome c peroxidase [Pseudomonas sp. NFACC44-2]SDA61622.1 cytochrome c peroxidase [Pseudomonas sp. NFACC51]SEJ15538.1 cytochrome c peroxidase [Pseudomonas sp. NFACC07-1]SFJ42033.1 cytochrome c peroxidase [Pseudomonas sp. NFACC54]
MALHGLILALGLLVGSSVTAHAEPLDEPLKPLPAAPALDPKRVQLGLRLFNDPRLSVNNTLSCASCHRLDKGGADDKPFSLGFDGKPVEVNTPTVFNAGLNFHQFWDGRVDTLEEQVHAVVTSPAEMGSTWESVVKRIANDPGYAKDFKDAYPDGVTKPNIQGALADYERTLQTPNSRFDQYLLGNTDILTPREKFGYQRFKEYGCIACHQGVNIGGNMFQKFGVMGDYIKDRGNPTRADEGRFNITGDEADRQVFKVPSLRNVAVTAPYFHDASAPTLERAVEIMFKYQLGREPLKNDTTLIVEFLKTLTGESEGKPL